MNLLLLFFLITKPKIESFVFNGDMPLLGFFDPLQITKNKSEKSIQYLREAELHHGRLAMISSLFIELKVDQETNQVLLFYMFIYEITRILKLYKNPLDKVFELRDNVQPGYINTYVSFNEESLNRELLNGRIAMIACIFQIYST